MEKQLFKDYPPDEREQYLRDGAYKIDQQEFYKQLSEDERRERQEKLSALQAEILQQKQEKAEVVKQYNEALKDMQERNDELVRTLKMNAEEVCDDVFLIPDEESHQMGIYTKEGELIQSRPLQQHELQTSIFEIRTAK